MKHSSKAIGIFDSGVGGLTVMKELMRTLPNERFIYFGDTARVPYGNKSPQTIIRYSIESTICLLDKNIKFLVVACNTISAFALIKLSHLFNIPILGVIEPGAEKAIAVSQNQRIAVLGTKGTIQSGAYQTALQKLAPKASILSIACPLFVPLVEEQWLDHPATHLIVREYLKPLKDQNIDTLLLGCTHYPLLQEIIQQEMGPNVTLVDSASTCAEKVLGLLKAHQLNAYSRQGENEFYSSDDPEKFRTLGEKLFGNPLSSVELLSPSSWSSHN
jgi:glutamate racemase